MNDSPQRRTGFSGKTLLAAGLVVAGLAAAGAVYGIDPFGRNVDTAAACPDSTPAALRAAPFARGEVAAVSVAQRSQPLPKLAFADRDGKTKTLAEFGGRTVLFNLWATWCVPCRQEMPALDALQAQLGGTDFEVVAVNIDTRDADKPKAWLAQNGIRNLAYFADPGAKVFQDLKNIGKAFGMPTTLLVGRDGCEIATIAGPAEWASADALALVRAALGR